MFLSCLSSPLLYCHLHPRAPTQHWKGMKFGQHCSVPGLEFISFYQMALKEKTEQNKPFQKVFKYTVVPAFRSPIFPSVLACNCSPSMLACIWNWTIVFGIKTFRICVFVVTLRYQMKCQWVCILDSCVNSLLTVQAHSLRGERQDIPGESGFVDIVCGPVDFAFFMCWDVCQWDSRQRRRGQSCELAPNSSLSVGDGRAE